MSKTNLATHYTLKMNGRTDDLRLRQTFPTVQDAVKTLCLVLGWEIPSDCAYSHWFQHDNNTRAMCVYRTQQECDDDPDGAYAPKIIKHTTLSPRKNPMTPDEEARCLQEFRDHAITYLEEYEQAALEGYDVRPAVMDDLCIQFAFGEMRHTETFRVLKHDGPGYDTAVWEERKSPRPPSFQRLNEVRSRLGTIKKPPCVSFELGRIQRVRFSKDETWHTTCLVTIQSPLTANVYVFFLVPTD